MEGFITILVFVGVIAVTAVIFAVWVIVAIIKLFIRALTGIAKPIRLPPMPSMRSTSQRTCGHDACGAANPAHARFCRRCGRQLPEVRRVNVRRAAMW